MLKALVTVCALAQRVALAITSTDVRKARLSISTALSGSPTPHGTRQHGTSAASEATVRGLGGGQPNRCGSAQAASPAPGWLPAAGPCIWLSSRPNEPG